MFIKSSCKYSKYLRGIELDGTASPLNLLAGDRDFSCPMIREKKVGIFSGFGALISYTILKLRIPELFTSSKKQKIYYKRDKN